MTESIDFTGSVVVVTGGARGVGRGITEAFLAAGADVAICGRKEPAAEELPAVDGRRAVFYGADVRDAEQAASVLLRTTERFGRVDVLVNNAGGSPAVPAADASPRFVAQVVALNLLAPMYCAQAANAAMQATGTGGSIVNIASVSGLRPSPGTAAYGAAKAGLINLTRTLAVEWAPKVRVELRGGGDDRHRGCRGPLRRGGRPRRSRRHRSPGSHGNPRRRRPRLLVPGLTAGVVYLGGCARSARGWRGSGLLGCPAQCLTRLGARRHGQRSGVM